MDSPAIEILTDLTEASFAAAVEFNSAEWLRLEVRLPRVELHDDGDVFWVFSGDIWPRNSVALAQFTAAVLAATGMGCPLDARLGFREVCKLSFWKYGKMRQL